MQKIIQRNGQVHQVVSDNWQVVRPAVPADGATEEPLQLANVPAGAVIVPLAFWLANKEALIASRPQTQLGVWLGSNELAESVVAELPAVSLVAIDFPVFRDGRGYSTATLLRTRYGYQGDLRAIGDVLFDQLKFMGRCGFNQMALRVDKNIDDALRAFNEISVQYQGTFDQPLPLFRRRAAGAAA